LVDSETGPTPDDVQKMGAFIEELASEGILVSTDGLQSSAKGARVRSEGGKITVVDGPFTEAKELIGGFAIIDVPSKEAAIEVTRRFLAVAGDGESEVRQMHEAPAFEAAP
jgi:hypothetical protein